MEKVISFTSVVNSISDVNATDLALSIDLERALKDGYSVKEFKQIIVKTSLFNVKNYIVSTFILEKSSQ